jgi:hypothetical protein
MTLTKGQTEKDVVIELERLSHPTAACLTDVTRLTKFIHVSKDAIDEINRLRENMSTLAQELDNCKKENRDLHNCRVENIKLKKDLDKT